METVEIDKHLLGNVFSFVRVRQHTVGDAGNAAVLGGEQCFERLFVRHGSIPVAGLRGHFKVGAHQRSSTVSAGFVTLRAPLSPTQEKASKVGHPRILPEANGRQGSENHDRVDAFPPLLRPVNVREVQPQGESSRVKAGPPPKASAVACEIQSLDGWMSQVYPTSRRLGIPPNEMVDVKGATADVVKATNPGANHVGDSAHGCERDQEAD